MLGFPAGMVPEYKGALFVGYFDALDKIFDIQGVRIIDEDGIEMPGRRLIKGNRCWSSITESTPTVYRTIDCRSSRPEAAHRSRPIPNGQ